MGKNKKCEEIKDINRNMFYILGILFMAFGLCPLLFYYIDYRDINALIFDNGKISNNLIFTDKNISFNPSIKTGIFCVAVFMVVFVTIAIFMFIWKKNETIWIDEDGYKKMKCKDL